MKAVIAGCGFISGTHAAAIRSIGAEVVWAAGRNAERTRLFAEQNGIPHYTTSLSEALESDADVVHICTPPAEHAGIIRQCLEAGKHVICEKPLCIDPEEAAELAVLAEKSGLIAALCCNVRYYPACLQMAEVIRRGDAGKPFIITGSYFQEFHIPPHPYGWRFSEELSGGQRAVSEIGTHWIDLAHAVTGKKITSVRAELGNWYPVRFLQDGMLTAGPEGVPVEIKNEDAAAVTMRFEDGAIGTLILSEVSHGHSNDLSIEIACSDMSLKWEEEHASVLSVSDVGRMTTREQKECEREETFAALFRDVYAAIGGKEHGRYPDFRDGEYIARVCSAIKESGESGKAVMLQYQ